MVMDLQYTPLERGLRSEVDHLKAGLVAMTAQRDALLAACEAAEFTINRLHLRHEEDCSCHHETLDVLEAAIAGAVSTDTENL